ncbi:MAG: hypothetical protein KatS3mg112_0311 [Thermogutta sp.]|nr:MAG: hypothetical protein KatS3mg112_0311 [Thermogutta sp.]
MKWPYGEATGVADETWAIETEHLTKVYGGEVIAVNDLSFRVPKGVIFGFLGPNGAGKTTTLRLLLGLQRPTAGRAWIFGHACGPQSVTVRRLVGYLPTNPGSLGTLNHSSTSTLSGSCIACRQMCDDRGLPLYCGQWDCWGSRTSESPPFPPARRRAWGLLLRSWGTRSCSCGTSQRRALTRPPGDSPSI